MNTDPKLNVTYSFVLDEDNFFESEEFDNNQELDDAGWLDPDFLDDIDQLSGVLEIDEMPSER